MWRHICAALALPNEKRVLDSSSVTSLISMSAFAGHGSAMQVDDPRHLKLAFDFETSFWFTRRAFALHAHMSE
jgi:hypothetical protein